MFRRIVTRTPVLSSTSARLAPLSTTQLLLVAQDPVELEREKELRQQVLQKYKGMVMPEMTNIEYGHFSTGGIQSAAAQQAMRSQGFGNVFGGDNSSTSGSGGCGTGNCGPGSSGMPSGMPGAGAQPLKVDWLMLFTGAALMWLSGKILYNQMTRGVDDLDFPLWTASLEVQAKHLIFCVQFDEKTREDLKRDFQHVRQANPFADFFEWVRSRRPEFCFGNRHNPETSIGIVIGALSNTNSRELMTFATALRRSLGRRGGEPLARLDEFLDSTRSSAILLGSLDGKNGSGTPHYGGVPPYTPPAQTQHPFQAPVSTFGAHDGTGPHSTDPFELIDSTQKSA